MIDQYAACSKHINFILYFFIVILLTACRSSTIKPKEPQAHTPTYDSHVHIMSPALIESWKALGIPFTRPASYYTNIDTILNNNAAAYIDLIGMGYVYENVEYYQEEDTKIRLMAENDYLLQVANKYPSILRPYIAIDPLKTYALNEIERCKKLAPKIGLKLHFNASQVYLTEPEHLSKVKPVFHTAAVNHIPILLHFDNWHPKFGSRDLSLLVDSILYDLPALNIRIAHFGTSGGFNQKTKNFIDAYLELRNNNRISERHQILLDISAVALDKDSEGVSKLTVQDFQDLRKYIDNIGLEHIIFGTDYPLYSSDEYLKVLKMKLNFTEKELAIIMGHKQFY